MVEGPGTRCVRRYSKSDAEARNVLAWRMDRAGAGSGDTVSGARHGFPVDLTDYSFVKGNRGEHRAPSARVCYARSVLERTSTTSPSPRKARNSMTSTLPATEITALLGRGTSF